MLLTASRIHRAPVPAAPCGRRAAVINPPSLGFCKVSRRKPRHALSAVASDSREDVDSITVDQLDLDDPFSHVCRWSLCCAIASLAAQQVEDVMRDFDLKCASAGELLSQVQGLDAVSGLPVVDDAMVVIGVLSRKDVDRAQQQGVHDRATVGEWMSTPPITVRARAHVGEAAAIMMARRLHRLPVVDANGRLQGILSRTDVFRRQLRERPDQFKALAVDGPTVAQSPQCPQPAPASTASPSPTWAIKYLYDGDCSICRSLKALLERQDGGKGRIVFVNIASSRYDPEQHAGIAYEDAMASIHAIRPNGEVIVGPPALLAMYDAVGLGWVAKLAALPVFAILVDALYGIVSKLRLPLGGAVDALLAAHRMKQVGEGVETCMDNEEECEAPEW